MRIHAGCVSRLGRGLFITGESGTGKSRLAYDLIAKGWMLTSDDWTEVTRLETGDVVASAPNTLRGLMEVRGVGIMRMPIRLSVPVLAWVHLSVAPGPRLPDADQTKMLLDVAVPYQEMWADDLSLPNKCIAFWTLRSFRVISESYEH